MAKNKTRKEIPEPKETKQECLQVIGQARVKITQHRKEINDEKIRIDAYQKKISKLS